MKLLIVQIIVKWWVYIFSYKLHFWASNEYEQLIQSYLLTFQDLPVTCVLVKMEVDISHVNQTFVSKEVIYRIDGITSFLSRSKSTNRIVDLRKVYAYRNETGTQLKQFVEHRATLHRLTLLSVTYHSMHMNASVNFVLLSLSKV